MVPSLLCCTRGLAGVELFTSYSSSVFPSARPRILMAGDQRAFSAPLNLAGMTIIICCSGGVMLVFSTNEFLLFFVAVIRSLKI